MIFQENCFWYYILLTDLVWLFLLLEILSTMCIAIVCLRLFEVNHIFLIKLFFGQVNYTEFAESAESAKKNNYLSSYIKNYLLRIISQLTLIPFHGFLQSKITLVLFSANSAFSAMALYVKTKTWNSQKVSKTFIYYTSDE